MHFSNDFFFSFLLAKGNELLQVVAVKQLDRNGLQGNKEFLAEIANLSLLQHPNLVKLVGYCADGDQRLLVYEFITGGTLERHLFGTTPYFLFFCSMAIMVFF